MDASGLELETSLSFQLLRTAHAVLLHHQRALGGTSLTLSQFWVLKLVCDGRASRPSEVARRLGVHAGDVTRLVRGLSAKGLLTRSRQGGDQRSLHLAPTARGREVTAEFELAIASADAELTKASEAGDSPQMIAWLAAIRGAV